jgi:two-component system sensor histidine kinase AlgZ
MNDKWQSGDYKFMSQEKQINSRKTMPPHVRNSKSARSEVSLPDLCNFGLVLRVLLLTVAASALLALEDAYLWQAWSVSFFKTIGIAAPTALLWIVVMCALGKRLRQEPPWARYLSAALVAALAVLTLLTLFPVIRAGELPPSLLQSVSLSIFCAVLGAAALHYFELRARAFSPALASAKLQALQSRIRPHFLFNSLNTAAALARTDPERTERLLEDLSDVFRAALRVGTTLVPLQEEIELAQQYAAIEQLRLGDRLRIEWKIAQLPQSARVPSLLLQPLLENAVHHGIEPVAEPGDVQVRISTFGRELRIEVENSYVPETRSKGSGIALANIKERLNLLYDLEAQMRTGGDGKRFRVYIKLPIHPDSQVSTGSGKK